jgi:phosphatidate cytidylyltransferase
MLRRCASSARREGISVQFIQLMLGLAVSGALLIALEHRVHAQDKLVRKHGWLKYLVYLAYLTILLATRAWGWWLAALFLVSIACAASLELRRLWPDKPLRWLGISLLVFAGLGHLLLPRGGDGAALFSAAVLLVAVTDSFAQLVGKLIGKHKLCPQLSPGKTVEGLLGGFVAALGLSLLAPFLLPGRSPSEALILAAVTATAAVLGDLSFSWIKRRFGLKDFSNWIPAHGGVLDRVDSLVFGAPAYYWTWRLLA